MTRKTQADMFIKTLGDILDADRELRRAGLAHKHRGNDHKIGDGFPRAAARTESDDAERSVSEAPT